MQTISKVFAVSALALGLSAPAWAVDGSRTFTGVISASTEMTGATYTGSLSILGDILTLTMDPSGLSEGFLTGIAFNTPTGSVTSQLTGPSNFVFTANDSANPFGTFDVTSATGGNWEGGGAPNQGIAIAGAGTGTWTFQLSSNSFSVGDFFALEDDDAGFVARFRGLAGQAGSDKVPGVLDDPGVINAIPEPSTYALMLAGLGAVGFLARRRKV